MKDFWLQVQMYLVDKHEADFSTSFKNGPQVKIESLMVERNWNNKLV